MKITVLAIGKLKSKPVAAIADDYSRRISKYVKFEIKEMKNEAQALDSKSAGDFFVLLDEKGEELTSEGFATFIAKHQMRGTKRLVFFIGGAEGAGKEIRKAADETVSLSKLTFQHDMVQAILSEQIYRALSIIAGSPYHRG